MIAIWWILNFSSFSCFFPKWYTQYWGFLYLILGVWFLFYCVSDYYHSCLMFYSIHLILLTDYWLLFLIPLLWKSYSPFPSSLIAFLLFHLISFLFIFYLFIFYLLSYSCLLAAVLLLPSLLQVVSCLLILQGGRRV